MILVSNGLKASDQFITKINVIILQNNSSQIVDHRPYVSLRTFRTSTSPNVIYISHCVEICSEGTKTMTIKTAVSS